MITALTLTKLRDKLWLPELAFLTIGRNDTTLALLVMARNGSWLNNAAPALLDSAEVILKAMPTFPIGFAMASERLRDDLDFVVDALSINPLIAQYASPRLQAIILDYENRDVLTSIRGLITIDESKHGESALRIYRRNAIESKKAAESNIDLLKEYFQFSDYSTIKVETLSHRDGYGADLSMPYVKHIYHNKNSELLIGLRVRNLPIKLDEVKGYLALQPNDLNAKLTDALEKYETILRENKALEEALPVAHSSSSAKFKM